MTPPDVRKVALAICSYATGRPVNVTDKPLRRAVREAMAATEPREGLLGKWTGRSDPAVRPRCFAWRASLDGVEFEAHYAECQDCGTPWPQCPMIHDDVWRGVGLRRGFICVPCLGRRLGRRVGWQDLRQCRMNEEPWVNGVMESQ